MSGQPFGKGVVAELRPGAADRRLHQTPHLLVLAVHRLRRIHLHELEDEGEVLVIGDHPIDELPIARQRVVEPGDILPGLVEAGRARGRDPAARVLRAEREVDDEIRPDERGVELQQPVEVEPASGVPRQRREEVPIGDHRLARPERRQDGRLEPVTKVGRVEQRVFLGGQDAQAFS